MAIYIAEKNSTCTVENTLIMKYFPNISVLDIDFFKQYQNG